LARPAATKFPPDLTLGAFDAKFHKLQNAHETQSQAPVVSQIALSPQTFRSLDRCASRPRSEDDDAFLR